MKQLLCVLILLTSVFAGDLKLVEFSDQAYGTKGWKVVNVPKTKDKGRLMYWGGVENGTSHHPISIRRGLGVYAGPNYGGGQQALGSN